jgi:hypothetical protein
MLTKQCIWRYGSGLLSCLVLVPSLLAQDRHGRVIAIVRDLNAGPIKYTAVYVVGDSAKAVTDSSGKAELALMSGHHLLRAAFFGYKAEERWVEVVGSDPATVDFKLEGAGCILEEVTVTLPTVNSNDSGARALLGRSGSW